MSGISFSADEKTILIDSLRQYFSSELDQDLGQFDAEFLLDFISSKMGPYYYNRGLYDARAVLARQLDTIDDAIYEIEQPTELER